MSGEKRRKWHFRDPKFSGGGRYPQTALSSRAYTFKISLYPSLPADVLSTSFPGSLIFPFSASTLKCIPDLISLQLLTSPVNEF